MRIKVNIIKLNLKHNNDELSTNSSTVEKLGDIFN